MARNLLNAADALERAVDTLSGLEALIVLLCSAKEADMPSGRAIAELLEPLQQSLCHNLQDAQSNMQDKR